MDKIYIVMDYVEHDLKVLMEHMTQGFRIGKQLFCIELKRGTGRDFKIGLSTFNYCFYFSLHQMYTV